MQDVFLAHTQWFLKIINKLINKKYTIQFQFLCLFLEPVWSPTWKITNDSFNLKCHTTQSNAAVQN